MTTTRIFAAGKTTSSTPAAARAQAVRRAPQPPAIQRQPAKDEEYTAVLRKVAADKVWLVGDPSHPADTLVDKLDKGEAVTLIDIGREKDFNQRADLQHKWWKVKVFVGAHQDKEGWVREALLERNYDEKRVAKRLTGKLGDGEVHVDTGVAIAPRPVTGFYDDVGIGLGVDDAFRVTYEGKDAEHMRWLQFAWREIIGIDDKGNSTAKAGPVTTDIGTYQLTEGGTSSALGTPTRKENFNTDSQSATDPFADAAEFRQPGGTADRTARSTSFLDKPGAMETLAREMFDAGAKAVISRAHFPKFLVEDARTVRYHTLTSMEWRFDNLRQVDKPPAPAEKSMIGGRAGALPPLMAARLHEQFPAFSDLK